MQSALDRRFDREDFFFQVDELLGEFSGRLVTGLLPEVSGKRLQAALGGDGGFRFPLGLVRQVKVFKLALAV